MAMLCLPLCLVCCTHMYKCDELVSWLHAHSHLLQTSSGLESLRSCMYEDRFFSVQAAAYMQQWHFPNTYCFSKHLAEALMADRHCPACPVAIVRPSIIGAVSGAPLPGYVGNTAGSTGAAQAIATGKICESSLALSATEVGARGYMIGASTGATCYVSTGGSSGAALAVATAVVLNSPVTDGLRGCNSFLSRLHTHSLTQCILVSCFIT